MQTPPDDARLAALRHWLATLPETLALQPDTLEPASSDASFRRYFRLKAGDSTLVVMDAPPPQEDCRPFVHVTRLLQQTGVSVPGIVAQNLDDGFLLLTDLGRHTYYQVVQTQPDDRALQAIYRDALHALVAMQQAPVDGLQAFTAERLREELAVFPEWYIRKHCGYHLQADESQLLERIFPLLVADAVGQAQVLVHRDFHSPNLMLMPEPANPGIIDHQDALVGPISYDIASLVMDARTTWEEPQQIDWAIRYWEAARNAGLPVPSDFAEFHRHYEWMGLQRNLRILGVFARLALRDNKPHYLDHIPRVEAYVRQVAARYGPFRPLLRLLDKLHAARESAHP